MRKQLVDGMAFSFSICSQPASSQGEEETRSARWLGLSLSISQCPIHQPQISHSVTDPKPRKSAKTQRRYKQTRSEATQHSTAWVGLGCICRVDGHRRVIDMRQPPGNLQISPSLPLSPIRRPSSVVRRPVVDMPPFPHLARPAPPPTWRLSRNPPTHVPVEQPSWLGRIANDRLPHAVRAVMDAVNARGMGLDRQRTA